MILVIVYAILYSVVCHSFRNGTYVLKKTMWCTTDIQPYHFQNCETALIALSRSHWQRRQQMVDCWWTSWGYLNTYGPFRSAVMTILGTNSTQFINASDYYIRRKILITTSFHESTQKYSKIYNENSNFKHFKQVNTTRLWVGLKCVKHTNKSSPDQLRNSTERFQYNSLFHQRL